MEPNPDKQSTSNETSQLKKSGWWSLSLRPFRTATLRGLAIILPPLLTIIFFIWAWNVIENYMLMPVEAAVTRSISYYVQDIKENREIKQGLSDGTFTRSGTTVVGSNGVAYARVENGQWIPVEVIQLVEHAPGVGRLKTANDYYEQYVKLRHLKRHLFIPAFLALFLTILYLLGKLLAAGIGRIFLHYLETLITQLPIIRNVYSSVKQVTDFALNENEMSFTRIVAVEYPRRGIWSMGFVTGEGMTEIRAAAGEPMLTVLMPTSPMPATGFTISVPKSETIDLDITIDQAVQFCVSCGVVIPDQQQTRNTIEGDARSRTRQIASQESPSTSVADHSNKPARAGNQDLPNGAEET